MTGRLNCQNWAWETLTDRRISITVSIDYGDNNNATAKWGLAGGAPAKRFCLQQQEKEGEEQESDTWLMACRSLQRHAKIYDRTQPVAHGHRSNALIDQFVIYTWNGWRTAVVGVNEGNTGRILMPSVTELLFLCGDGSQCLWNIGNYERAFNVTFNELFGAVFELYLQYRIPMFWRFLEFFHDFIVYFKS